MRKFLCSLLIWSFLPSYIFAKVLTTERHIPLTTDSLLVYKFPYRAVTDSGKNCTWDFSDLSTDSSEVIEMNYFAPLSDDTMYIGLHREKANYYYHYIQDTLWLTGYETSLAHVRYTSPLPLLQFPFAYGDTMQGVFSGKGQYCHIIPLSIDGSYTISADAVGKLILPEIEIDSTIRVYRQIHYSDTKTMQYAIEEDCYAWYSPYSRYPLIEAIHVQTAKGSDTVSHAALYYFPQEQENMPSRKDKERDLQIEPADSLITDVSFMPNPVYADLQVHYTLVRSAQVYISVHYNGGVTTYQTPIRVNDEGEHSIYINMAGMPVGNYVVYIYADDTIVSGNIIKL